jgi:hypothetical protein
LDTSFFPESNYFFQRLFLPQTTTTNQRTKFNIKRDFSGLFTPFLDRKRHFKTDDKPNSQTENQTEPKTQTTRRDRGIEEKSQLAQTREAQLQRNDSLKA